MLIPNPYFRQPPPLDMEREARERLNNLLRVNLLLRSLQNEGFGATPYGGQRDFLGGALLPAGPEPPPPRPFFPGISDAAFNAPTGVTPNDLGGLLSGLFQADMFRGPNAELPDALTDRAGNFFINLARGLGSLIP